MRSRGVSWVLACAFGDGTRQRSGENGTAEDPGPVRQRMDCLDLTSLRRKPECFRRHLKKPRGIVEVKPRFDSLGSRLVDGDAVMGAQRGDTLARPTIAIAGHQPVPVQDAGDEIVVGDQHQLAHSGNHIGRSAGALPAPPPGQAYLGVDTANPMDEQNDLGCIGVDIGNHLMDHGADDALLQPCIGRGGGPNALEVGRERGERCRIDGGRDRGGVMGSDLGFDLRHAGECLIPSRLQFASHQSVGRVGSVVLPEGPIGSIVRRFEITPERLTHLVPSLARLLLGSNGRRNGARTNDREKGTLNGVIHPQPAKSDATRLAIVHPTAGAAVARDVMLRSRVAEGQFTPASATTEQAGQQGLAVLGRPMVAACGYVAADHLADRFGLLPADITLMGVRHQRQPIAACFATDLHLDAGPFVAGRDGRLTICIGAAVDGVLDHSVDRGVVWAPPSRLAILALHRQIQIMLEEPEQSLSCAAKLQDFVENQTDGLLHAAVRVLLVAVACLDEAHRRADDEFAAAGFLVTGGERTLPQQVKLILVETAFEAEQKPIVAMTRRVDRLLIDQHGIDHAAHLDQLLPVPAVAGESRDFACGNRANFAEADLRHHTLKTGALDATCSGTAKIFIDHLDLGPAKCSQAIAHGVLQRAALPVVQNLMSRRLANVDDRFALQMMRADLVRDHDRPSSVPSGACRHGPGSASSSGWSVPPASSSIARTRPARRRWSARSLRTGRSAAARGGVPASVCSGVAWVSPRFWSPERGDTPESAASDAVQRWIRASRKSAPSITSAGKSVWGSTATRILAQADRSNIHAGISSQRFVSDAVRPQRKTTPPGLSIAS